MTRKGILPVFCAFLLITAAGLSSCDFVSPGSVIEVDTMLVGRGNISEVLSASGKVAPEQTETVVSDASGKITEVLIEEDDEVTEGQVMVNFEQHEPVESPVAGRVLNINSFEGQWTVPGTPLMTVGDEDTYLLTSSSVGEISDIMVKVGDPVLTDQAVISFEQPETIKSPVVGTIFRVTCYKGQIVTPGTPLMTIEDDTDTVWQVVSNTSGEISDVLVKGAEIINDILVVVEEGDDVNEGQDLVEFKQPEPVIIPAGGKVLGINSAKGQTVGIGTPLMTIGDEDTHIITSDASAKIISMPMERGDSVVAGQVVAEFEQPEPVTSPITGKVLKVNALEGQVIMEGTPLTVIADTDPFYLVADIDEVDISRVKVGQDVVITLDAYPDATLNGRVDSINFSAIDTPVGGTVFPVKIEIISADDLELRLGMTADIEIAFANHAEVFVVPKEAVVRRDGRYAVFVVQNSIALRQEVELGISNDDFYEIKSGLAEGQEIVINASILEGGERVTPTMVR